ncbi:hypothetical protein B7463_g6992, partial [Scytalidium lignicola]
MQSPAPFRADKAQQACAACKLRKRKCDRALPRCSWCSRKRQSCNYSFPGQNSSDTSSPSSYPALLEESRRKSQALDFSTMLFMDPMILQHGQLGMPRMAYPIPSHVLQLVGDMNEATIIASRYFETVHVWMPIISKKRFYDHHLQPMFYCNADMMLLLLSMKLITAMLPTEATNPRTPAYYTAKHFYFEIEASGMMSIQVLQASLLLSLYELGHAIYPSAYLSIGACTRYAYALGINKEAKIRASKVLTLVELEENKRVWWGIVILDRFLSIGSPGRPFATETPTLHDPLPADDSAWDMGVVEPTLATLYSPTNAHMSKFSLLCQTAAVLGEVLDHISKPVIDQNVHDEEELQLDQTLHAMISVCETIDPPDHDQISMIYGALMTLNGLHPVSNNVLPNRTDRIEKQKTCLETISKRITSVLPEKMIHLVRNHSSVSPWGLFCAYQAAVTYMQLGRETNDPNTAEGLALLRQTLSIIRTRWNAAGVYLQLLEAREAAGLLTVYLA